jgi:hypothetical protein
LLAKLFIDVDDTLVLYLDQIDGPHPLGLWNGLEFRVNTPLIEAVREWMVRNSNGQVIVWSGGGADYAKEAADRFVPGLATWCFNKGGQNLQLPAEGDTLVDDSPNALGLDELDVPVLLPDHFISLMK